ncbi:TRAP transporter substrate-binding protein [Microbaculum marinum]
MVAAVISLPLMAAAADPIAIKLATNSSGTDDDVYTIAANKFTEALEEVAPGQFEVTYYPNRQLGDEKELMQGLQLGTVDMAIVTNSTAANVAPQLAVNDLPFLYSSQEQAAEILDGPLGEKLFDALEQKNIIGLSFCESGYRQMINNAKPIETPEDVVGVKFRVMQSPLFIDMFRNLGGAAVPMAWGDTVTALQQGTVDGLENAAWTIPAFSLDEITKYLSLTNHIYTVAPLMMSKSFYSRLSSEQQEAIHKAGMLACERQRVISAQHERDIIEGLKASGKMQVNEVQDIGAFREKMAPLYEEYRDRVGSDLLDQWLAAAKG